MAFNLDFSHVPSIPGIPTIPSITTGISPTSVSLMDKITSNPGGLFSNPLTSTVNTFGGSVNILESQIKDIASGNVLNPSISMSDANTFISADGFNDIRTSMGNFMMHVGRLSGLLQSQGINAPGLQQILSIGTQMQNMMTILNAGKGCLPVIGGATGLFSSDAINTNTSTVNALIDRVSRGAATIADVTSTLAGISNLVKGIIDKDSEFLQNCVRQLQSAAVALVIQTLDSNPCAHFIFEQISNRNPGGVLDILSTGSTRLPNLPI